MTDEITVTVELTEGDYFNIMGWWTASTMMAEGGLRTKISESERETINKISCVKEEIRALLNNER